MTLNPSQNGHDPKPAHEHILRNSSLITGKAVLFYPWICGLLDWQPVGVVFHPAAQSLLNTPTVLTCVQWGRGGSVREPAFSSGGTSPNVCLSAQCGLLEAKALWGIVPTADSPGGV